MNPVSVLTLLTQIATFLLVLSVLYRMSPIVIGFRVFDQIMRNITGAPVAGLSVITPQIYIGGQHHKRGWGKMQSMGITAIVNMRETQYDDRTLDIAPDRYLHLPTIDNTAPTIEHLRAGVEFITQEVDKDGVIYIHCASGFHRAPTMATAYFMSIGMSLDEAIALIKKKRPFARPLRSQKKQLELFATQLENTK